jgi:hypothetical protein
MSKTLRVLKRRCHKSTGQVVVSLNGKDFRRTDESTMNKGPKGSQ